MDYENDIEEEDEEEKDSKEESEEDLNEKPDLITDPNYEVKISERITPNFMTKYEKARIIGTRAV